MAEKEVLRVLKRIVRIAEAGEKGYATASTNATNPGVKLFLKSLARQRENFKTEVSDEMRRLGGDIQPGHSILGTIHRGRVAIFSAMTIENDKKERTVLREAAFGEKYALRAYERSLAAEMPPETREILQRQHAEVQKATGQIQQMLGADGQTLIVRLFDTEADANAAVLSLEQTGIGARDVEVVTLDLEQVEYRGKGTTVAETILSGAFGGAFWGTLIGVLAAFGAVQTAEPATTSAAVGMGLLVFFATVLLAALGGAFLGMVIGGSLSEDDRYQYRQSVQRGQVLVKALVDSAQAEAADKLLDRFIHPPSPAVFGAERPSLG